MKRVLLLGDSIRQNYQEFVKLNLSEVAKVDFPNDNGRFCSYTLRALQDWIRVFKNEDSSEYDVVHFNCGLWDVLRLSNEDTTFTSESEYANQLMRLVNRINYFCPKAKIIFALSTSVIEPGFSGGDEIAIRTNSDISRFNDIATNVLKNKVYDFDDLWSVTNCIESDAHSDCVHFDTDIGVSLLGTKVVESIKSALNV